MKVKYWIETIEYPYGLDGTPECVPNAQGIETKEEAIDTFNYIVEKTKKCGDRYDCVALYRLEDDYDERIEFFDNDKHDRW